MLSYSSKSNFLLYQLSLFFQFQTSTSNFAVGHSKALNSVCMSARGQGVVDEERWKDRVNVRNTLLKIHASV